MVQPIRLPSVPSSTPTGKGTLTGWGSTSKTNNPIMPTKLQTVDLPLIDLAACKKAIEKLTGPSPLHETNICTGPLTGGFSACSVSISYNLDYLRYFSLIEFNYELISIANKGRFRRPTGTQRDRKSWTHWNRFLGNHSMWNGRCTVCIHQDVFLRHLDWKHHGKELNNLILRNLVIKVFWHIR